MAAILCSVRGSTSSSSMWNFKSISHTGSTFFNRSREMDLFKTSLMDKPTFIDEANELRELSNDPDGSKALRNFFKCLVLNTKERSRFHVLFCSSDSFFHLCVSKYIGSTRYETFVVGDLPKQEALCFWNHLVERHPWNGPLPEIETI